MSMKRVFPGLFGALAVGRVVPFGVIHADQLPAFAEARILCEDGSLLAPEGGAPFYFLTERSDRLLTEAGDTILTESFPRLLQEDGSRVLAEDGSTVLNAG